jgi:MFS family permease
MLSAVLDQTILATALPTIAHDLGRLPDVSWVIAAYVVTAAASTPLWGKLGDRLGRKRLLRPHWCCSLPRPRSGSPPRT